MIFKQLVLDLIPDSLKDSPLFNDVLSILSEYIEEHSQESLDTLNIYNESSGGYSEIVKAYAHNFLDIIEKAKNNVQLQEKLIAVHKQYGVNYDTTKLSIDPSKFLNRQNVESLKNFYQTKGTLNSFKYVYDIFNKLQLEETSLQSDSVFDVSETGDILTYDLKTNMLVELYEQFVKPMVHPLGWAYVYTRLISANFKDYAFVKEVYNIKHFTIDNTLYPEFTDNFKTNIGHLFETNEDGSPRLVNNRPVTYAANGEPSYQVFRFGKYYNELNIGSEICLVQDPNVTKVETGENGQTGDTWIRINFESGEYIEQHSIDPELGIRTLRLYYGDGPNELKKTIKKDYTPFIGEYGLDIQYTTEYKTLTNEKINFERFSGLFDTIGSVMFCGCGNAIASDNNICGTKKIANITDNNSLTRVTSIALNPNYQNTRQSFLGFKYKKPNLYLYISLEHFTEDEFPINVRFNESVYTINFADKQRKKRILEFSGISINERYTLKYGYTDKSYTVEITDGKGNSLESCTFRLIPNLNYYTKDIEFEDFDFDYNPSGEKGEEYSRMADMQYFDEIVPPEYIDTNADTYEIAWQYIECNYFAVLGDLYQLPKSNYIKETEVFDFICPKYYSNMVGHFKLFDFDIKYSDTKKHLTLDYPKGSFCNDFDFEIVTMKA